MELHQLRYLVAVAQAGSFSRAAERCHVSQPSLSQQIAKLERRVGQRLFDRLGRRVVLTDAGRLLADRATAILAAVDDAERQVQAGDGATAGRLTIGAIPTVAPYLLPPVLERFACQFPGVELTVQEDVTQNLLTAVRAGDVDLAVLALPIDEERLQVESLLTEPLLLALPPGHRLSRRPRITLADLQDERFILLNEMHCLGDQVLSFCKAHSCLPKIACRSAQITTVQCLIALGQGISLLPAMAQATDPAQRRNYRPLADAAPTRTIAAAWHRQRYHSPAAARFLEVLRGWAAQGANRPAARRKA